ncbi:ornithine cyclodeaminase family protein [Pseudomonas sp. B21-028]|uniref:ornithine cyclodeaminase family protein n=1 Tax=Pseudomonas TaxID=286 RepID=UPI00215E7BF5|nr:MULTISPECIES: ornithine cyclodeaminase family protein [Pseudomonas]UVL86096.1 ornithine cyclodeaminase family protein [Pseudomonas sp. B21-028]UVM70475.1 ornithine cyclodeaminase family protein [Pseudomonas canavaninivorans]
MSRIPDTPFILQAPDVKGMLTQLDITAAMRSLFESLAAGTAVQPPQQQVDFPNGQGDFINYLGVMSDQKVYGIKTSPYIKTEGKPLVTAWSILMSMETGAPLLIADAGLLTTLRTAATTALAIDYLAPKGCKRLAVIGSGPIALAHIEAVKHLRPWEKISIYSLGIASLEDKQREAILALDPRISVCELQSQALSNADVVMLCTSSPKPVLNIDTLGQPTLITSISTNALRAHEIDPGALAKMDVYCDYRQTTPQAAGEMVIAAERKLWSALDLAGDLAELSNSTAPLPAYARHVFFRSIGLGLEDVAVALQLYKTLTQR